MTGKFEGPFDFKEYLWTIIGILLFIGVIFLFTGCSQKLPVVTKTIYVQKECPTPKIKPIFKEYEMQILKINGIEYYTLQKSEAIKMSTNWISYREWAEANYLLIKKDEK